MVFETKLKLYILCINVGRTKLTEKNTCGTLRHKAILLTIFKRNSLHRII